MTDRELLRLLKAIRDLAQLTYPVGKDTSVAPELLIPFGQIAAIADGAPAEYDTGLHYWLPPDVLLELANPDCVPLHGPDFLPTMANR